MINIFYVGLVTFMLCMASSSETPEFNMIAIATATLVITFLYDVFVVPEQPNDYETRYAVF